VAAAAQANSRSLRSLIPDEGNTYVFFHNSFREFVTARVGDLLQGYHRRWAERGLKWRALRGYEQLYALRHLPSHLIAASRGPDRCGINCVMC